jgi:hypothetical protein
MAAINSLFEQTYKNTLSGVDSLFEQLYGHEISPMGPAPLFETLFTSEQQEALRSAEMKESSIYEQKIDPKATRKNAALYARTSAQENLASLNQFSQDYRDLKKHCYAPWTGSPVDLYTSRLSLFRNGRTSFNEAILRLLDYGFDAIKDTFKLRIDNIAVCENCFCLRVGICKRTLQYRKKDIRCDRKVPEHGNKGSHRPLSEKGAFWRVAMREFFGLGDAHPVTGQILLSPMKRADVFEEIKIDCLIAGKTVISVTWFRQIWRLEFPHGRYPPKQRLGKCVDCVDKKDALMKEKDPAQRLVLKEERREHITFVKNQKASYYDRRHLAEKQPDKYLSIIY